MPTQRFLDIISAGKEITEAVVDSSRKTAWTAQAVSGIVSRRKRSRGSFYQYFEDMADAWELVAAIKLAREKSEFLAEAIPLAGEIPSLISGLPHA